MISMHLYYARSPNSKGQKETVRHHLQRVSELCAEFASAFRCSNEGKVMGLLHDLGKYSEAFEQVLMGQRQNVDHATPGALVLKKFYIKKTPPLNSPRWPMVAAVHAHHGKLDFNCLDDIYRLANEEQFNREGKEFSINAAQLAPSFKVFLEENVLPKVELTKPSFDECGNQDVARMLYTRMLFSCLVDADYSTAAEHYDENYLGKTALPPLDYEQAFEALEHYRSELKKKIDPALDLTMSRLREELFQACLHAGSEASGLFTLTAPTGTGKTLALLAFGLSQLKHQNKRRIIVVLPYLSITEQNADIYRNIIPNLLEVHSQNELTEDTREFAERWSARFIITTSVRFFEGLFASKSTDCRHLHQIADSVIIFDEAQSLPPQLTGVTLQAMQALCARYNCSVVFSTATQPSFNYRADIEWHPREIVTAAKELFFRTKRVEVEWRTKTPTDLLDIAAEMNAKDSVCAIVNLRAHARKIYRELHQLGSDKDSLYYMTADMCPAHRRVVLADIRKRLEKGLPCRLVATQCIEAGVDLSFDDLYRALAPLEAIIQAAGRCNRHNILKTGRVVVFIPEEDKLYPGDFYRLGANKVLLLLNFHPIDINNLSHIDEYYRLLYEDDAARDSKALRDAVSSLDFAGVEQQYKLIDKRGVQIIVPYNHGKYRMLFEEIRNEATSHGMTPALMKKAAPITVSSYDRNMVRDTCEMLPLRIRGKRESLRESGWYALGIPAYYDNDRTGLDFQPAGFDGNIC